MHFSKIFLSETTRPRDFIFGIYIVTQSGGALPKLFKLCPWGHIWTLPMGHNYVSPMKWGVILFLAPLSVCPSVCLSVTLSCLLYIFWTPGGIYKQHCTNVKYDETMCIAHVWPRSVQGHHLRFDIVWLYFVSALYLLNPWWDLQITLHKCQVWWENVQCLCLTKVGSRSRSQSNIKHCMTVFRVRSISFEPLLGFTKNVFTNVSYDGTMCSAYVWPRSVQDKGQSLRFNGVWLYFVSALYLLNPWCD